MKSLRPLSAIGVLLLGGIACAGDGTGVDLGNGNGGGAVGFAASVQPILTSNCALSGCHAVPNLKPSEKGMNLSQGQAYANLVGVRSAQSALSRVAPGVPDQSYLVHKIEGTQASVGGSGSRMPLGGSLSASQIETIRSWIAAGAQNN
jgi:hypothetical protein